MNLRPTPGWVRAGMIVLLVWAAAVRVWMASTGLESGHYWDERYSVKNARAVIEGGTLEPSNYYYPSLSYLPQAGLMAAVEAASRLFDAEPFSFFGAGGLDPEGYRLARLLQIAYGLGTLVLTFLLGRRLISAEAGLVAALLLAVAPQHVRLSTMWKPDIALLFFILLTLWWTLQALDRPTLGRYLLAGAGIGLALAAKLNGGPVAAPLALGALAFGRGDRRHWRGLIAAAAVAVAVFAALNPHVGRYLDALERNRELYSNHAKGPDPSLLERVAGVASEEVRFVLSDNFHGAAIGATALAGLLAIAVVAARRRDRPSALLALSVLAFPLAYTGLYAVSTPYAKENNFLQILPFSALAAAFLLAGIGAWLARRLPASARLPAAALATAALAIAIAAPTQAWVYRSQVPDTWELAMDAVAERLLPWDGRVAYIEAPRRTVGARVRETKGLLRPVDDLAAIPPDLLDQADAEVFDAARLEGPAGSLHRERAARAQVTIERVEPRWFVARGSPIVTVLHPREAAGSWTVEAPAAADGSFPIDLSAASAADSLSVEIRRRRARGAQTDLEVLLGERSLRLYARPAGRQTGWLTERFDGGVATLTARVPPIAGEGGDLAVTIYGWR